MEQRKGHVNEIELTRSMGTLVPPARVSMQTSRQRTSMATSREDDAIRAGFVREDADAIRKVRAWIDEVARRNWGLRDRDEAVQDSLLKLVGMARSGRIRSDTRFRAFVVHVARLACIDAFRRQCLRDQRGVEYEDSGDPRPSTSAEDAFAAGERHDLARVILQALSPSCRQLLRWVLGEDRPYDWIADKLQIRPGAARVRAHRCLKSARELGRRHAAWLLPGGLSHEQ
jgi:RNA polymerase sigma factor (sigma-70 family)